MCQSTKEVLFEEEEKEGILRVSSCNHIGVQGRKIDFDSIEYAECLLTLDPYPDGRQEILAVKAKRCPGCHEPAKSSIN